MPKKKFGTQKYPGGGWVVGCGRSPPTHHTEIIGIPVHHALGRGSICSVKRRGTRGTNAQATFIPSYQMMKIQIIAIYAKGNLSPSPQTNDYSEQAQFILSTQESHQGESTGKFGSGQGWGEARQRNSWAWAPLPRLPCEEGKAARPPEGAAHALT